LAYFTHLIIGMGCLLLAQAQKPQADSSPERISAAAPAATTDAAPASDHVSPWYIILNGPEDLDALWRKVERPDLVVIKGDQLPSRTSRAGRGGSRDGSVGYLVESVKVRGRVARNIASLTVELVIVLEGAGPFWVPIRLDDQTLSGAREGSRELSLRKAGGGPAWQVKISGTGEHRVEVDLRVPLSVDPARKTLSVAIALAASTALELIFAQRETDIIIGANEDIGRQDPVPGQGIRLTAPLSPRSRLEVSWTNDADPGAQGLPLLTAQGGIAVDIDSEQMRTRSSWSIRCIRGVTRALEIGLDDLLEVTELQLDEQAIEAGSGWVRGKGKLTIRLADALRPGGEKKLVMKTRRSFPPAAARRISFAGFPLANARDQSGAIGITQSSNLWVSPATAQGLRRITAGELPTDLRKRPSTSLAFEFLDQPFLLELAVEASPPLVRAESRTYFQIDTEQARSESTIKLEWVGGRLLEVDLGVGNGLLLVSVGPSDVVESSHLTGEITGGRSGGPNEHFRKLKIALSALASGQNKATIKLAGVQRISSEGSIKLGLFTPVGTTSATAYYALAADRSLALVLDDESGRIARTSEKAPREGASEDGRWPTARRDAGSSPLLLAGDGNTALLPIRIKRLARSLAHESALAARITARAVDVVQQSSLAVRHGSLSSVDVRVPKEIGDGWDLLEKERIERVELGREPDGATRYRLSFDRPILEKATLRFRFRVPLYPALDAGNARQIEIPWISFAEGRAGPTRVVLSLAPELVVQGVGPGWLRSLEDVRLEKAGDGATVGFVEEESGRHRHPFAIDALALETMPLAELVVPRLLIKTVYRSDGTRMSTAWFWVETHGRDFPFALPDGARWIGARVDGRVATGLDYDPKKSQYRLKLPGELGTKPVLVELDYQDSDQNTRPQLAPPRLLDGGVVLQSLWELRLPWTIAQVGIPRGWSDENQWYWTGYVWKRRPWKGPASLNDWLLGAGVPSSTIDDFSGTSPQDADSYLFSRSGEPAALSPWLVPRSWLVGVCSGGTLLVGFVVIFAKLRIRTIWVGLAVLGILAAALVQPGVTLLALESASIGAALAIMGLLFEGLVERWKSRSPVAGGRTVVPSPSSVDSSFNRAAAVGSDDSTAIRVRVPSTQDYLPISIGASPRDNEGRSSQVERA
jgi:hypothetical protein